MNALLDYVRRGFIEIKDDFSIIQHLQNAPGEEVEINYKKITGQIVKQKCPTLNRTFEFLFPVINQGGLRVGYIDDWNTIGNQLKD